MCIILMHECNRKTSKAVSFDLITHAKRVNVKHTLHPQIRTLTQFICKFGNLWKNIYKSNLEWQRFPCLC